MTKTIMIMTAESSQIRKKKVKFWKVSPQLSVMTMAMILRHARFSLKPGEHHKHSDDYGDDFE